MSNHSIWQGQLVRLRAVEPEDWEQFFQWDQDTEVERLTYYINVPRSREATRQWTAESATARPRNDEYRWVIENLQGEFVGTINTHTCDPRWGTFHYGLAIGRDHWRKGYASEAIRLVLAYFFWELRYQKVNVTVYGFNEGSLKLHQKFGFQEEGRLRRMVYTGGVYYDSFILGMTREEFEATYKEV